MARTVDPYEPSPLLRELVQTAQVQDLDRPHSQLPGFDPTTELPGADGFTNSERRTVDPRTSTAVQEDQGSGGASGPAWEDHIQLGTGGRPVTTTPMGPDTLEPDIPFVGQAMNRLNSYSEYDFWKDKPFPLERTYDKESVRGTSVANHWDPNRLTGPNPSDAQRTAGGTGRAQQQSAITLPPLGYAAPATPAPSTRAFVVPAVPPPERTGAFRPSGGAAQQPTAPQTLLPAMAAVPLQNPRENPVYADFAEPESELRSSQWNVASQAGVTDLDQWVNEEGNTTMSTGGYDKFSGTYEGKPAMGWETSDGRVVINTPDREGNYSHSRIIDPEEEARKRDDDRQRDDDKRSIGDFFADLFGR